MNNIQKAVLEHWKTDVLSQGERTFLLALVLTYSVSCGEFPSLLQVGCFPGIRAVLVPPWLGRARGQLWGWAWEDGRFLCALQALCISPTPEDLCICRELRSKGRSSFPENKHKCISPQLYILACQE